ncbi:MAG: ABC transporter permease [Verrucomicrobiaceae bacterium]|nr:MAG: ABC transporter permease [Verrucomicrobiaceae bacterium]
MLLHRRSLFVITSVSAFRRLLQDGAQIVKAALMTTLAPGIAAYSATTLGALGLKPDDLSPIDIKEKPVQVGTGTGAGGLLVSLLPYLLVLFTFTGGVALAADLVAGEKERSTLETLLIAPVRRTEIVLGKFLALAAVCVAAAISGLLGFALSAAVKTPGSELVFKSGLGLTPSGAAQTFLILLPLAATFSGVLIAVSSYARNSREAQTYLGMLNLVVMIPAVFSQIIGLTDMASAPWLPFVPILGAAAGIRSILLGKATALAILGPFGIGVILAAISIMAAIRLFHRENVLLRV